MKRTIISLMMLLMVSLSAACSTPGPTLAPTQITPTQIRPSQPPATASTNAANAGAEIESVVTGFGKRLQMVSLLSPSAAQDLQAQYADFVAPALLQMWMSDPSKAPGRAVSSPWPDRIEITSIVPEGPGKYAVTGFVVEITSVELVSGGAAARIPVHIDLQKTQGRWLITEYAEQR